jgi:hypothetical protein
MPAGKHQLDSITQLLSLGEWKKAREEAKHLIALSLDGLRYLQT